METLIIQPENNGKIKAFKCFLRDFKIRFESRKENISYDLSGISGK